MTRSLAVVTAVATWILIAVGGYVRVTGSGMGCPDWPHCYGRWIPPADVAAWIEMVHRYAAGVVSALVALTVVAAWRQRKAYPGALVGALTAAALILVQIGVGAWTVFTGNRGDTVVVHLVIALLTLGALVWAATNAGNRRVGRYRSSLGADGPSRVPLAAVTVLLVPVTLAVAAVGAGVQVTNGGFACPEFPLCNGSLWPASMGQPALLHMAHRGLVLVMGGLLFAAAALAWRLPRGPERRWSAIVLGLYGLQFAVGVAQVVVDPAMPLTLRWVHLALGSALWAGVIVLAAHAVDSPVPVSLPGRDRVARPLIAGGQPGGN